MGLKPAIVNRIITGMGNLVFGSASVANTVFLGRCCGGFTNDTGKAIFRINNKHLSSKPDRWSLDGNMTTWKRSFKRREVEQGLAKVGVKVRSQRAIEPVSIGP